MEKKLTTVLDLGNYTTKFKGNNEGKFSSKITTDFQPYEDGFQRIELNGVKTYIGIGELDKEFNKSSRNWLSLALYAICKAHPLEDTIETNLTLLLPISQMPNKNSLLDIIKNKEFEIKVNGKDKIISINDAVVLPEGFISFHSLDKESKKDDICIIDIGSRTINICTLISGKMETLNTVKLGSIDFYSKVKSIEDSKGNAGINIEDVERLINRGNIKVTKKMQCEFLNDILNSIKPYVNINNYSTYFTGGTSLMLKDIISENLTKCKIMNNAETSNLNGAFTASEIIWSNKNGK